MTTLRLARPEELPAMLAIDDATRSLFATADLYFSQDPNDAFTQAEAEQWGRAIARGLARVALDEAGTVIGFITLALVDGAPYVDQLSVHPTAMRRGIGTRLLRVGIDWAGARPLWLTTYAHLPWNAPYYERFGFTVVDKSACGPQLRSMIDLQLASLPLPEKRVVMVRR
jgi:GNAT superfamily N-acetyltransferase